jgi:hypothetical protein
MDPRWARNVIADCRRAGVAPFHKQWGAYRNNPLVAEQGMSTKEAERLDKYGKGGGLIDGKLVREFPNRRDVSHRHAAEARMRAWVFERFVGTNRMNRRCVSCFPAPGRPSEATADCQSFGGCRGDAFAILAGCPFLGRRLRGADVLRAPDNPLL